MVSDDPVWGGGNWHSHEETVTQAIRPGRCHPCKVSWYLLAFTPHSAQSLSSPVLFEHEMLTSHLVLLNLQCPEQYVACIL